MTEVGIVEAGTGDAAAWARLRDALWPGEPDGHRDGIDAALAAHDAERLTLLAVAGDEPVGLAEAAIRRDFVNGCDSSPVAFLEGLYVAPAWRRRGIARRLVERVAAWGSAGGYREFASDALLDNDASRHFHRALGFAETERVVFFRRALSPQG